MKFNLGQTVMTCGIANKIEVDGKFATFVSQSLTRHSNGDWGDLCKDDIEANESALINGERLLSKYDYNGETSIYIITEWNRSVTTILFPCEY